MLSPQIKVTWLTLVALIEATCYLPNGTAYDDPGLQPCSLDITNPLHTTCCHSKWDNPPGNDTKYGPTRDECLPNGLCQYRGFSTNQGDEYPPWTHYYRVYCTNEDWSNCLDVCDTGLSADSLVQLTPCDGTSTSEKWCCGDTTYCCSAEQVHQAVIIPQKLGEGLALSAPSSFPSADVSATKVTPIETFSALPSHSPASGNASSKGRTNIGIGLGVGLGVGVPTLCFIAWLCLYHRKRHCSKAMDSDAQQEIADESKGTTATAHELAAPAAVEELSAVRED